MWARFVEIDLMDLKRRLGSRDDSSKIGHSAERSNKDSQVLLGNYCYSNICQGLRRIHPDCFAWQLGVIYGEDLVKARSSNELD